MQRDRDKVEASLQRKGFQLISGRGKSKDHRYYRFYHNDSPVPVLTTKVSLGSSYKSLGDSLLGAMARQCSLPKDQFIDLIDCPLTQAQYEDALRQQEILVEDDADYP